MNYLDFNPSSRPTAMGSKGMATSAHPLASLAGINVLNKGGNAFDAIVAIASTLNVAEPFMSGMGGVGFGLVYQAKKKKLKFLDFSGFAPELADPEKFTEESKEIGPWAPVVPCNLAGWLTIQEELGVLEREQVFEDAINHAQNGIPVTYFHHTMFSNSAPRLSKFPSGSIILDSNGKAPLPGSRLKMPELAESFKQVASGGRDVFYKGAIAQKIINSMEKYGGLITQDDLDKAKAEWSDPVSINYKGYDIFTSPPHSSGFQALETLKLIETLDPSDVKFQDPEFMHFIIESTKLTATDRIAYWNADRDKTPLKQLLSNSYAKSQASRISSDQVSAVQGEIFNPDAPKGFLTPGDLDAYDGGMTTHFAVADRDGNVVTITQTLGGGFGSALAPEGTGIFLNNMGNWFALEKGSSNLMGPLKRQDNPMCPMQIFKDGEFQFSIGTPGSWGILQTTPQMIVHLLDFNMNIQQAIESPRLKTVGGKKVEMEARFPYSLVNALGIKGHQISLLPDWSPGVGGAQGIYLNQSEGIYQGGSDPRRDGFAIGT